jgi:NAD(P)-dependent dehydrogenase (short-subunit alcohol dehydrogenase family)
MTPPGDARPVCVVTGAGGLLGSAFCRRFSERYQLVAVWHRRRPVIPTQGQHLLDPLAPHRPLPVNRHPAYEIRADLRKDEQIERLVETVLGRFGRIDMLVNAVVAGRWASLIDRHSSVTEATAAFRVNVAAPLALTAVIARRAWHSRPTENRLHNRCVVNVSSTAGVYVYPGYGQGVYSASKAALNILSRHLAAELEPLGIRVNVLAPDAFPSRVAMSRVLDGLQRLAEGDATGQVVLQLAEDVEHVLQC